ncbi:MAG: hypothetical protein A2W77_05425 [Nitrospinae bacterium RIFCSPLOWO2_12_39_16]|nr:MAG: hypothetical protein A2W77_05425 [Nitrospinae bacterium RIFCSPLOWO2_12_39_16]HLA48748.1 DUF2325 domain-containing protein [Nitrospinota bacterium]
MCVALIGGMDRLKREYERTADGYDIDLRHFARGCPSFEKRLNGMDTIIIFTNRISHDARKVAIAKGNSMGVPVLMCHSSGISSLKRCLCEIKE